MRALALAGLFVALLLAGSGSIEGCPEEAAEHEGCCDEDCPETPSEDCPAPCGACACCASPAAAATLDLAPDPGAPAVATVTAAIDEERPAAGVRSRVFRPPRAPSPSAFSV
jgi:hypothetical protein